MKEWGPEPDEQNRRWVLLEATAVSIAVLGIYVFAVFEILQMLYRWLRSLAL